MSLQLLKEVALLLSVMAQIGMMSATQSTFRNIYKGVSLLFHMINTTKTFRMKYSTYRRIRQNFKCRYGETVSEYFERLSEWLKEYVE